MKKNKKSKLIIFIIILILILLVLLKIVNYIKEKNLVRNGSNIDPDLVNSYLEENNVLRFAKLEKIIMMENISVSEVTNSIDILVKEEIPKLYENIKDLDDDKLKKYYNENKNTLLTNVFLKSEDEFIQLAKNIKNLNCDLEDYKYCEFVNEESDVQKFDNLDRFLLTFNLYYKNNECINFKLEFIKYHV